MSGCSKRKPQSSALLEQPNASSTKIKSEAAKTASKPSNDATKKPMTFKQHIMHKISVVGRAKAPTYNFAYDHDHTNTKADTSKDAIQNWCNLIANEECSIEGNVIKSDETDEISLNGIESRSTECAIPTIQQKS